MSQSFVLQLVEESEDTRRLTFTIVADLKYLEGHFPSDPIVPGVAQVVSLAETQARLAWPELGPTRELCRLKFKRALRPGDELSLRLERGALSSRGVPVAFQIHAAEVEATKGKLYFAEHDR